MRPVTDRNLRWAQQDDGLCFSFFAFRFSTFEMRPIIIFWRWKSNSDIQSEAEYRILTFLNPILTFELRPIIELWHSKSYFDNHILTFEVRSNNTFWHSKSYFDIQSEAEYRILTFEILFWHSRWDRISNYDIRNSILIFELRSNIEFWHSAASELDLHCLSVNLLGVSRLQWVNYYETGFSLQWLNISLTILFDNPLK